MVFLKKAKNKSEFLAIRMTVYKSTAYTKSGGGLPGGESILKAKYIAIFNGTLAI